MGLTDPVATPNATPTPSPAPEGAQAAASTPAPAVGGGSPMAPAAGAAPATPNPIPSSAGAVPNVDNNGNPTAPGGSPAATAAIDSGHGSAGKILRGALLGILSGAGHVAKDVALSTHVGQQLQNSSIERKGAVQAQQIEKQKAADEHAKAGYVHGAAADAHTQSLVATNNLSVLGHGYALANEKTEGEIGDADKVRSDTANKESQSFLLQLGAAGIKIDQEQGAGYDNLGTQDAKDVANGTSVHVQNGQVGPDKHGVARLNVNELKNTPISAPITIGTELKWNPKTHDVDATKFQTLPADGITTANDALTLYGQGQARIFQIKSEQNALVEAAQKRADLADKQADAFEKTEQGYKAKSEAGMAQAGITDQNKNLKGEEFVKTLPSGIQDLVRGMGTYALDSKDLPRGKEKLPIEAAVLHAYGGNGPGGWTEMKYQERHDYLKEYGSSKSGDGATRRRIATAVQHGDMLNSPAITQALAQHNLPALNALANEFGVQTGSDADQVYDAIADKFAGEVAGAVKGGAGQATDPAIDNARTHLKSRNAPQVRNDIMKGLMGILQSQVHTVDGAFTTTMGKSPADFGQPVVPADIQATLDKYNKGGGANAVPPTVPDGKFAERDKAGNITGYADDAKGTNYHRLGQ